ncbi:alpha/beta hydrolase [Haloarculaceae archaeon H-GB2-1]|nr:alpha/beta hydrolase [Haloarculaceae archaeon H-GB2-1]
MTTARTRPTNATAAGTTASPQTVPCDGRTVAYAEYGSPDGTPLLFFHGTPGSRILGTLFDSAARERDVRVIAPDRPGYGRSDPWPDRTPTDVGAYVDAILADADVSAAAVVGFSGGATYALALAATRPDVVTAVDLVASPAPPAVTDATPRFQRALGTLASHTPAVMRGLYAVNRFVADHASPSTVVSQYTSDDGPPVPDDVAHLVARDFREALCESTDGAVTETCLFTDDWGFDHADVRHDVRLWHGARDENAPLAGARDLRSALPHADLSVFDDADHLTSLLRSRDAVLDAVSASTK